MDLLRKSYGNIGVMEIGLKAMRDSLNFHQGRLYQAPNICK